MDIHWLTLSVCSTIIITFAGNELVLSASTTGTDDCCEKYDHGENVSKTVFITDTSGSVVNLTCPFSTSTNSVSWRGPPNETSLIALRQKVNTNLKRAYKWITESEKENILQISNVSEADEGSYVCQTIDKFDTYFCVCLSRSPTSINIENLTTKNELISMVNKELTMTCTAEGGRPKERMIWSNADGKTLISGGPKSLRYIFKPKITDEGKQFTCKAYHSPFYALNISVTLRVFSIPYVQIRPFTNNTIHEGDSILMTCDSSSNDPFTNYTWYGFDQVVSRNNTLSIRSISRDESGTYVCEAKNRAGVNKSEINIVVQYAPNVSVSRIKGTKSNDIVLSCNAVGIPNSFTFFQWEHKTHTGQHLRFLMTGETLLIPTGNQYTHYYNNGIYFCNVSNGIPNRNGQVFQRAQYQLFYEGTPAFFKTNDNLQYGHYQQQSTIIVRLWSYPNVTKIEIGYAGRFYDLPNNKFNLSMQNTTMQDVIYGKTVYINGYEIKIIFVVENENQFTKYTVRVFNEKGDSERSIDFKSANRPETPSNLTVITTDKTIKVLWNRNFDGGYPQSFIIQYRPIHSYNWTESQPISDNHSARQEAVLFNLLQGTLYDFRIFARNSVNDSDLSEIVRVKTIKINTFASIYGIIASVTIVGVAVLTVLVCRQIGKGSLVTFQNCCRNVCKGSIHVQPADGVVNNHGMESQRGQIAFSSDVYCSMDNLETRPVLPHNMHEMINKTSVEQMNSLVNNRHAEASKTTKPKPKDTKALNYVEIHFERRPENSKFVIHGINEKTNYVDIDFTATAEPLPESSSEEETDESDDFMSIDFL